mmetsp:Transcript_44746/g.48432  ORF Transcript_44746/g.48432 Transcript_44746/m.48432 type:complete len:101 (+) Transcript_44746:139-441(+)
MLIKLLMPLLLYFRWLCLWVYVYVYVIMHRHLSIGDERKTCTDVSNSGRYIWIVQYHIIARIIYRSQILDRTGSIGTSSPPKFAVAVVIVAIICLWYGMV